MHESRTTPTANMTYTRSQNYTNVVVGKYGIQTFEDMVVVLLLLWLSFDVLSPPVYIPYYFAQVICLNVLNGQF